VILGVMQNWTDGYCVAPYSIKAYLPNVMPQLLKLRTIILSLRVRPAQLLPLSRFFLKCAAHAKKSTVAP
jgi:hypothetical protein